MDERDERQIYKRRRGGSIWAGLFILLIGGILLLDQMNFPLPDWLFSWHLLLIALGLFIGLRHNFRGGAWLILIIIGGALTFQDYHPESHLYRFIWPGVLIFIGLMIILRPSRSYRGRWGHEWRDEWEKARWTWRYHTPPPPTGDAPQGPASPAGGATPGSTTPGGGTTPGSGTTPGGTPPTGGARPYSTHPAGGYEDFIDATSIFGGVHRKILSKNFKGGDITTIMGGTEIDLTQADFTGTVRLEVTQVMGGTKILVPPHWEVRSEVNAVLAGFEDKRQQSAIINPDKVLIIVGTSILGGIELKNY